jgi:hypothetical protein
MIVVSLLVDGLLWGSTAASTKESGRGYYVLVALYGQPASTYSSCWYRHESYSPCFSLSVLFRCWSERTSSSSLSSCSQHQRNWEEPLYSSTIWPSQPVLLIHPIGIVTNLLLLLSQCSSDAGPKEPRLLEVHAFWITV